MMNPRRVDRLLDVHVAVDHVRDYVEDCIYYCWTTRTANRKPKAAVFAQDECGRHRRQRTLAWRDRVALALDQAIEIWRAGFGGKVIHLVIHDDTGAFGDNPRSIRVVERVRIGHGVTFG